MIRAAGSAGSAKPTGPAPTADTERTSYGFDGKRNGAFPPVYIDRWCRWQSVPTEQLIGELRHWADYLESLLIDGTADEG